MAQRFGPYTRLKALFPLKSHSNVPLASEVLTAALQTSPYWTSYFIPYRSIINDQFGYSHFNWQNEHGVNYHILRIGCYPYIKYHCSRRPVQDLGFEDRIYTVIKMLNLGIPTLAYGVAGHFLIKFHKDVHLKNGQVVRLYFLYKEDIDSPH